MRRALLEEADAAAPWALAGAAALVYAATVNAPVFGDDRVFVESAAGFALPAGEFLRALFSREYFTLTGEGTYQPLTTLFHYFTHGRPALYRGAGIALHALNAELVRRAARRLGAAPDAALLGGFVFLLFPTHPETLIISAFKGNLLALTFTLGAFLCWARGRAAGAFACFLLALASKETGLLVPAWLAGWTLLFERRRPEFERRAALVFALAGALYLWWRFIGLGASDMPRVPWNPAALSGWYAAKLAWPFEACRERTPPALAWSLAAVAYAAAVWAARRRPAVLFGLLAAALGVAPHVWRARYYMDSPVADRFLYMSAAGLALALSAASGRARAPRSSPSSSSAARRRCGETFSTATSARSTSRRRPALPGTSSPGASSRAGSSTKATGAARATAPPAPSR
ncbi:MAG: hypothetical protein M0D55_17615 [Elusimicrobiota bacterium]|nr:MAG: hypothetical protein M0D55_17615 [Elusimicrobiota bacterium]